jgi:twitching motility protein PilI
VSDPQTVASKDRNPAWALLKRLEDGCLAHRVALPRRGEAVRRWTALALQVGPWRLLAGLHGEVREILSQPVLTRVPMTQPWLRGIANLRGLLLPVSDLQAFLTGQPAAQGPRSRVLVVQHQDLRVGLLVPEMLGVKRLPQLQAEPAPDLGPRISAYISHAYRDGEECWPVLSFAMLLDTPAFLRAELAGSSHLGA